ncbi:hypothetical protein SAMN04488561_4470 [Jiangella alba]|uniref:Uncharacterized protein n=1 Tax=Jiangella alba TaxID=561176 RepID=A0A1H5PJ69_9ACTN|nr:hypothetical protein SAMN04488561_4470 [Jiangella alba]
MKRQPKQRIKRKGLDRGKDAAYHSLRRQLGDKKKAW